MELSKETIQEIRGKVRVLKNHPTA